MKQASAINIAIDGYSSTGKSTLAKDLAAKLKYRYIDTGAMYRAVTLFAIRNDLVDGKGYVDGKGLKEKLKSLTLEFQHNPQSGKSEIFLNDENVEPFIRKMEVARSVSEVAAISEVRKLLVNQQQQMATNKKVVMDGRDIGTVVLPDAELKIFVTASRSVRVTRRLEELRGKGENVTRREVEANLEQRDLIDTTREDSPLKMAEDALLLDNSEISKSEQLNMAFQWAQNTIHTGKP